MDPLVAFLPAIVLELKELKFTKALISEIFKVWLNFFFVMSFSWTDQHVPPPQYCPFILISSYEKEGS